MALPSKALRAFEAPRSVTVYRVAGRRPSQVWVNAEGQAATDDPGSLGATAQQLKELVYWRTKTAEGDEIQDRVGGLFIVPADGQCHPIALTEPEPLKPETAFVHAQLIREQDAALIETLLKSGDLVEVSGRRPQALPTRPANRVVSSDYPLISDERPEGIEIAAPDPRAKRYRS